MASLKKSSRRGSSKDELNINSMMDIMVIILNLLHIHHHYIIRDLHNIMAPVLHIIHLHSNHPRIPTKSLKHPTNNTYFCKGNSK